jgi:hypothetical protein
MYLCVHLSTHSCDVYLHTHLKCVPAHRVQLCAWPWTERISRGKSFLLLSFAEGETEAGREVGIYPKVHDDNSAELRIGTQSPWSPECSLTQRSPATV